MIKTTRPDRDGVVRVTFVLPAGVPDGAVSVVGDFNGWDPSAHPLRRRGNGTRSTVVRAPANSTLRFRYLWALMMAGMSLPPLNLSGWCDPGGAPMADADDVRRLALALPEVEEIDSDGFDFRVDGKGFVWSYPERRPGERRRIRDDIAVLYVGDEAEKQALLLGEPGVFFTTPGYDGWPLVMLRLAEVEAGRLEELVTDAWRMRAPADLAAELDQAGPR